MLDRETTSVTVARTRQSLGPVFRVLVTVACLPWVCVPMQGLAQEVVVSDDGRHIQLNGDGTWIQLSQDRFATNAAGERIRLMPNGTWTRMLEDPQPLRGATHSNATVSPAGVPLLSEATLHLARVEILRRKIKRAKSIHAETRTLFHVNVDNHRAGELQLSGIMPEQFKAMSSAGGVFEILSVQVDEPRVAPGEQAWVRVEAAGSPDWFGVKYLQLEVAAGALGNERARLLSKSMDDVERRSVDQF